MCPSLQIPQSRGRLACGALSSPAVEVMAKAAEVVVDVLEELEGTEVAAAGVGVSSGSLGSGQVMSIHWSGQNSLILLKRYHCRAGESPDGMMHSGRSVGSGLQSSLRSFTATSGESDFSLTKT